MLDPADEDGRPSAADVVVDRNDRKAEADLGPAAFARLDPGATAHRVDQLAAHEQSDPGARRGPAGLLRPVEQVERTTGPLFVDADPAIENLDQDVGAIG